MQIGSWIAVYIVVWWICLFAVLPFGQHSQANAGVVHPGSEPGAPAVFHIWPKLVINSILAAAIVFLLTWALSNPLIQEYWK